MSSVQTLPGSAERATALLAALRECRANFEYLLTSLMPQDLALPTACSGWSVRDQIGHVIDGTEMLTRGLEAAASGQTEGVFQPQAMAAAMQTAAMNRAALLPLPALLKTYQEVADRLLQLFDERGPTSWDDSIPHPYLGTCPAVQFVGFALLDWFIHPWDITQALGLKTEPDAAHSSLIIAGQVGLLPKRFDTRRIRGWRGRFRFLVEKPGQPTEITSRLDAVLVKNTVTVERDVPDEIVADLTFKGQPADLVLGMLGRRSLLKLAQPAPTNETWLPRWGSMWISL